MSDFARLCRVYLLILVLLLVCWHKGRINYGMTYVQRPPVEVMEP